MPDQSQTVTKMSVYTSVTNNESHESLTLREFSKIIKGDKETINLVTHLRGIYASQGKEAYKLARKKSVLKLVTPSGTFSKRKSDGLLLHSGYYVYDLDDLGPEKIAKIRKVAPERCEGSLALMFVGPSGDGLKLILRGPVAEDEDQHLNLWDEGKALVARIHKDIDLGQDVCRLCYYSYDADCYYDATAKEFKGVVGAIAEEQDAMDKALAELEPAEYSDERIHKILDNAANRVPDLTLEMAREALKFLNPWVGHNEWFPTVMALKTQWGVDDPLEDEALALAHEWSNGELWDKQGENNYDKDRLNSLWRSAGRVNGKVHTMRTVLRAAGLAGYVPHAGGSAAKAGAVGGEEDTDWKNRLQRDAHGKLLDTHANILLILTRGKEFAGRFRYDEFHNREEYLEGDNWVHVDDAVVKSIYGRLETLYCRTLDYNRCTRAIDSAIYNNRMNALKDYLNGLVWDGKNRMEQLFRKGFCAPDTEANRLFSRKFMISCIARAMQPGCKVDTMPVVTGHQGQRKSSGWRALAGDEFFGEGHLDLQGNAKDAMEIVGKVWIYEMSELTTMRKGDRERVKGFVTNQVDTYRLAYARKAAKAPRKCVFVGTGNDCKFLNDPTGGRRYWPVKLENRGSMLENAKASEIGVGWISKMRDQLWAEAVAAYKGGEQWWLTPEQESDIAAPLQEAAREQPEWEQELEIILTDEDKWETNKSGMRFLLKNAIYTYLEEAGVSVNHFIKIDLGRYISARHGSTIEECLTKVGSKPMRAYKWVGV